MKQDTHKMPGIGRFINICLAVAVGASGMMIQIFWHIGRHAAEDLLLGCNREFWHDFHVVTAALWIPFIVVHVLRHGRALRAIMKKFFNKSKGRSLASRATFVSGVLLVLTGMIAGILNGDGTTGSGLAAIEIHDKLGILFLIFLAGHLRYVLPAGQILRNKARTNP